MYAHFTRKRSLLASCLFAALIAATTFVGLVTPAAAWTASLRLPQGPSTRSVLPSPATRHTEHAVVLATPPMGWNGYDHWKDHVTASIVEANARALISTGMKAAGYDYIIIDGGWDLPWRGSDGQLLPNPARFPDGIAPVVKYLHSLGFKVGLYTSIGLYNCARTGKGSYGNDAADMREFARWGIDYVKVDWCYVPYYLSPDISRTTVSTMLARQMGLAIRDSGRAMVYDVNDPITSQTPAVWARSVGAAVWRTTPDALPRFGSIVNNLAHDLPWTSKGGHGGWSDPDSLEIGNTGLNPSEAQAQISLWAELGAPLMDGSNVPSLSRQLLDLLMNRRVIAIDQDMSAPPGHLVWHGFDRWILTRRLDSTSCSVVYFNATTHAYRMHEGLAALCPGKGTTPTITNIWNNSQIHLTGNALESAVPQRSAEMWVITYSLA